MVGRFIRKLQFYRAGPHRRADMAAKLFNGLRIGKGCELYGGVSFGSEPYLIEVGNQVRITSGVKFVTHDGGMWVLRNNGLLENADLFGRIKIGNNVHIGINAIIMPGVTIGDNCVIGCGAVVTKSIPSNSIAAGIPAKVIKSLDSYYEDKKDLVDYTKSMTPEEKKTFLLKKYHIETGE